MKPKLLKLRAYYCFKYMRGQNRGKGQAVYNYRNIFRYLGDIMAEGVGFEPTVPVKVRRFSRPVP